MVAHGRPLVAPISHLIVIFVHFGSGNVCFLCLIQDSMLNQRRRKVLKKNLGYSALKFVDPVRIYLADA